MRYILILLGNFILITSFGQNPPKKTKREFVYFITRISPGVYDTLRVLSPTKSKVIYYYDTTTSIRKLTNH
jgi:hypothetical protein